MRAWTHRLRRTKRGREILRKLLWFSREISCRRRLATKEEGSGGKREKEIRVSVRTMRSSRLPTRTVTGNYVRTMTTSPTRATWWHDCALFLVCFDIWRVNMASLWHMRVRSFRGCRATSFHPSSRNCSACSGTRGSSRGHAEIVDSSRIFDDGAQKAPRIRATSSDGARETERGKKRRFTRNFGVRLATVDSIWTSCSAASVRARCILFFYTRYYCYVIIVRKIRENVMLVRWTRSRFSLRLTLRFSATGDREGARKRVRFAWLYS